MAKTKFDIKTEATKPLLAGVGVTDLAVEVVRDFVAETQTRLVGVQKDVTARVADVQKSVSNPQALRKQAVTVVNARVDAITTDAKARRKAIENRVADLQASVTKEAKAYPAKVQTLVDDNVTTATDTYSDLVKRGESLVGRIRRQESTKATVKSAKTTVSKAKATTTQAKKASTTATTQAKSAVKKASTTAKTSAKPAVKKVAATKSSAKATVTAAKKTASTAVKAIADATEKVGD